MVSQLVKHERIETTVAKVLASSPWRSFERALVARGRDLCSGRCVIVELNSLPFAVVWFQAKEVRRKADQMVQLGKEVNDTLFLWCLLNHILKYRAISWYRRIYAKGCV